MFIVSVYLIIGIILLNIPFKKLYNIIIRKNIEKTYFYEVLLGIILIIFSFVILFIIKIQILWLSSIPLMILGLDCILQGIETTHKELYLLSVATFVYAVFYILVQSISELWFFIQKFSLIVSSVVGYFIGKPLLLGSSTSGLWIVFIFLIFSLSLFFLSNMKKRYLALNIFGLILCWIFYLMILGLIEFESKSNVIDLHYVLFLLCLIPTFLYIIKSKLDYEILEIPRLKDIKIKKIFRSGFVWILILILAFGVILTVFSDVNIVKNEKKNILFYGQKMLGSWDVPEYGKYRDAAPGMFGLLPDYLTKLGYNNKIVVNSKEEFLNNNFIVDENITRYINFTDYTTIIESNVITSNILSDVDIFVIINLNESLSLSEQEEIWRFVENGGSLLVLGDHTNIGGLQQPLNDLLKPVGIQFRFDSALPIDSKSRWIPCYQLLHHPITYKIDNLDELEISVGASLNVNIGSFPIIIGRYGLSDIGDLTNVDSAFLGDYQYNSGEQIGDIILAAGAYYGEGKVLVFGDTSTFQNSAISYSLPFIGSVFNWLNSQRNFILEFSQSVISLVLILCAFILYLKSKKSKIHFLFFPLILCFALIISAIINPIILGEDEINGNIVCIDSSHGERFSLKLFEDSSLSGLMLNLMRNKYLPIILRNFKNDIIKNSEILIFNAPTKSFNNEEVDQVKKFMKSGGLVILSTGYQDKDASMPLIREFNLDIYDIPLGPVPYVEENPELYQKEPRFVDSWPILVGDDNDTEIFYSIEIEDYEYVLMTFSKYGDGGLFLISDSQFLIDKNLESFSDYWPGNIQFLKNILDEMETRGVLP